MTTSGERADTGLQVVSKVVAVANPAAGADWQFVTTAPGQPVAIRALFFTSAVVANRYPILVIKDNAGYEVYAATNSVAITANTGETWVCAPNLQENAGVNVHTVPLAAGMVLGVGWVISTATRNIDVGDQWSAIVLTFAG